ncbi:uncharacterized protein LOC109726793 [Ananas comosus]|uniref:Uncharacterized protein LOC109726793 n=1 Tax=Ananas comosus TaxID=4615 RepID=A0A6P5GU22_ANACO|nr:uncharacterized protein LOC109726793 [Ananas comosus]
MALVVQPTLLERIENLQFADPTLQKVQHNIDSGHVAYRLALPPKLAGVHNVFHVSNLRKYMHDPEHVLVYEPPELQEDMSYEEFPVEVLAREVRKLRNREIPYVKVRWSHHSDREATCELEEEMKVQHPHLFEV